jgi:hypothetical protein
MQNQVCIDDAQVTLWYIGRSHCAKSAIFDFKEVCNFLLAKRPTHDVVF